MTTVVLQVKGAPPKGVNPFAKKKKKADGQDPEAQAPDQAPDQAPAPGQPGKGPQKQPLDPQQQDQEIAQLEDQPDPTLDPNAPQVDPQADPGVDPKAKLDPTKADPADPNDPNAQQQPGQPGADPENPDDPADTQNPHEWAGDVDEDGDETDPQQSFAAFTRPDGAQAWLDRSDDGTLTGWVTDADGTVYRYSDPNAWAIDVDDAGMAQSHGPTGQQQADAQQQDQQQPVSGQPAAPGQERALFDDVPQQKDATGGGRVVLEAASVAADLAALTRPHLQAWARQ